MTGVQTCALPIYWGEPPNDREDEDPYLFYEEYDSDVDYDDYLYGCPSNWSCITDFSSRSSPWYDKHGREILELGRIMIQDLAHLPHISKMRMT